MTLPERRQGFIGEPVLKYISKIGDTRSWAGLEKKSNNKQETTNAWLCIETGVTVVEIGYSLLN